MFLLLPRASHPGGTRGWSRISARRLPRSLLCRGGQGCKRRAVRPQYTLLILPAWTGLSQEAEMQPRAEELDTLREEASAALAAWAAQPGGWRLIGAVSGALGSELRPVVELDGERYLLRRQPPGLGEPAVLFRQSFMRHLRA